MEGMTLIISERVFVSEDGTERLPVLSATDADGDPAPLETAVLFVAGPDKDGMYVQIDMRLPPNC